MYQLSLKFFLTEERKVDLLFEAFLFDALCAVLFVILLRLGGPFAQVGVRGTMGAGRSAGP